MNIFHKLKTGQFSQVEQSIVDLILEDPSALTRMSPQQLSKKCYVSKSSLYRLCEKLGLQGYADLKAQVLASMDEYLMEGESFDYDFPIKENQTSYQIMQNLKETYHRTTDITESLMDYETLRQAALALKKAEHISLYTSSGNVYFARNFAFQMQEIGINVTVHEDEYQQRLQAAMSTDRDIAIFITFGGRGALTKILQETFRRNKVPVILLSSSEYNPDIEQKSYRFTINPYENHYNKISSFSTRLSIMYILDCLYTAYFELDYANNLKKKLEYYKTLAESTKAVK